jgi:hypothetical protein
LNSHADFRVFFCLVRKCTILYSYALHFFLKCPYYLFLFFWQGPVRLSRTGWCALFIFVFIYLFFIFYFSGRGACGALRRAGAPCTPTVMQLPARCHYQARRFFLKKNLFIFTAIVVQCSCRHDACMYVCMYVCVCVSVCVCVCIHTYIHTYTYICITRRTFSHHK